METPSPYGHDEHMEKYRADREAREQAERDRLAAALGKDWNPVRPADVRAWEVVEPPRFKKDYVGSFVRVLDVPRHQYGGNAHDAVPDNAVMQIRTRVTGYSSSGKVVLNCDWHCPCCGRSHEKIIDESAIAEGKVHFLSPGVESSGLRVAFYLAAPYTHDDPAIRQQRWLDATRAAVWLRQQGHMVLSPISMGHPMAVMGVDGDWQAWQDTCLAMLEACASMAILQTPGWEQSVGIAKEADHAHKIGMPLWRLAPTDDGQYRLEAAGKARWW
ncbi:DUF1937 family protein [Nitratidesulfovibrio sp. HK-II]|uniref:DUF1937 family protein n=1 Tax=Nitratidesulfovibrio sp. HK-II TaxID=2009266 RepID=UPI003A67B8AA